MPRTLCILETALYVDDLPRAIAFYEHIFKFTRLNSDERFCAFSIAGQQVLLLFARGKSTTARTTPAGTIPGHDSSGPAHFALGIPADDFQAWHDWLCENQVVVESIMHWQRGGRSLYVRDPDQHLLELATPGTWAIF
jgi:catechol 2,3-dioxygenase-like lactoylglutathione lyase family enzyme